MKRVGFGGQGEAFPFSMPFSAAAAACGARRARAGQRGALGCLLGAESSTAGSESSMRIEGKFLSGVGSGRQAAGETSPKPRAQSELRAHDAFVTCLMHVSGCCIRAPPHGTFIRTPIPYKSRDVVTQVIFSSLASSFYETMNATIYHIRTVHSTGNRTLRRL